MWRNRWKNSLEVEKVEFTRYEEVGAGERQALAEAIRLAGKLENKDRTGMLLALEKVARAAAIAARRRYSNARYEARRRRLVGAQVPLELYERGKRCAGQRGISVYAFVMEAIEEACDRQNRRA